jgi:HTH-type transcriptional regulator/antitoxin HigA
MLTTTKEGGKMTLTIDPKIYGELLAQYRPQIITDEAENERALDLAETLANKPELTSEEEQILELLVTLIEKFESECYPFSHLSTHLSRLAFLLEANNLIESDLADIFGSKDVISEVFEGKRQISKSQAIQLGERFHLAPSLFLQ